VHDIILMIYIARGLVAVMQVSKWGNSLAVRLPKKLVDDMGLREGDELAIVEAATHWLSVEKKQRRLQALDNMRKRGWLTPDGYAFDRDEANAR
jgi:antitoxin MazE